MRMSRRAASTNAIHVRIFVSIDRAALIITTIFRVIALAHSTRVNSAIHTVSTHFYAKHTILSNFINRIFMCGAWLRNVRERMLFGDPFFMSRKFDAINYTRTILVWFHCICFFFLRFFFLFIEVLKMPLRIELFGKSSLITVLSRPMHRIIYIVRVRSCRT